MATEIQANLTLEYHQEELFKNPNLAYLAVVPKLDKNGDPTDEFEIEAGVYNLNLQISKQDEDGQEEVVPKTLKIPSETNIKTLTEQLIQIEFRETEGFSTQSFTDRRRPANGGCSVMNYRYNSAGTLGGAVRINGQSDLFFISNWHVLTGGSGRNGDSIIQPGRYDGGSNPSDIIATLYWSRLDQTMDAAIAKVEGNNVTGGTRCFGAINNIEVARVGMNVKKCGRTTRLTAGTVRSINASVRVSGYPTGVLLFTNQILLTHMSQGGDSGSVVCNSANNNAVGLLFAGDGQSQTIANHMNRVLGQIIASTKVIHSNGDEEIMPALDFKEFVK